MKPPTPWLHPASTKETTAACKAFMQNSKAGVEDVPLVYETIHQACCLRAAPHCLAAKTLTSPHFTLWPPLVQSGEEELWLGVHHRPAPHRPPSVSKAHVKLPWQGSSASNSLATWNNTQWSTGAAILLWEIIVLNPEQTGLIRCAQQTEGTQVPLEHRTLKRCYHEATWHTMQN